MAEALEDLTVVHSQPSGAPRKRARQDSACTMENIISGTASSSSNESSDVGLDEDRREPGRHKRQRGESHRDAVLSRANGPWPLSTPSHSRSLSPVSNTLQVSEHSESPTFSDGFIPLPTPHSSQEHHRTVNESNNAEEDIARSMEFDQQIDVLRRSPDSLASQTPHEGNTPYGDVRSELVPRLLRRMHLRSNEPPAPNSSSSVGTDRMGNSLSRLGSINRLSTRLRSPGNPEPTSANSPTNPWIPFDDERETIPSLFHINRPLPSRPSPDPASSHDRNQLPPISQTTISRNGSRTLSSNLDPIVSSSRTSVITRSDLPSPSSRRNPAPLRPSDWFQDMHDIFHPSTLFNYDDQNNSAESGLESPLSVSDVTQSRQSPEIETPATSTDQMEGIERTLPSSFRNRPSSLVLPDRLGDNLVRSRLSDPEFGNTTLRRSNSERNGTRNYSPVPWRNFLAGLDSSRESSSENLVGLTSNALPERQQTVNQGQSTSLVGALRDLLHRSAPTQGDSAPSNRRSILRNPFRSSDHTRATPSTDTQERVSGLIDDDFPVLSMPPTSTTTAHRPSRSLLDPALRFNSIHTNASPSVEQNRTLPWRPRRNSRLSWSIDDEDTQEERFIPEPITNERLDSRPHRSAGLGSLFGGLHWNPTTSQASTNPNSNNRVESPWAYRSTSDARNPVHSPQYLPGRYLRRQASAGDRPDRSDNDRDNDQGLASLRRVTVRSPANNDPQHRSIPPTHGESAASPESYMTRLQRHLRRLPTGNSQRNGTFDPLITESHIRSSTSGALSPDFLFSWQTQDNSTRPSRAPSRYSSWSLREDATSDSVTHEPANDSGIGPGDSNRSWRIPPVRNGESFNDLVRRRAARADAMMREAQSVINSRVDQQIPSRTDAGNIIGQRTNGAQLRAERLARLERFRNSLETAAGGAETSLSSRLDRERENRAHDVVGPRLAVDRSIPHRSNSGTWSNDTSLWNGLPRLPSLGRIPPTGQSTFRERHDTPLFANAVPSDPLSHQATTSAEDDISTSISRERQQLRGFLSRYDGTSGHSDPFAPFTDATTRLQRRLRESEAEVGRALRALDQWGEIEQRDLEPTESYMHRFGERRRRLSSFFSSTPTPNWDTAGLNLSQMQQDNRPERRSPSPTTLSVRQQARQARFARAQSRYREDSNLFGERRTRSRFELRDQLRYFPRILGDYIADEDFDSSYENLLQLSSLIGDVKPRGTAPHLLAKMPTGFYKDFIEPDGETRCPICLDDYKELDPVLRISDCSHWFHKECLEQWLQKARTCPLCKTVVKGRQQGKKSVDDAPGPSRRDDDDSDNDDSRNDPSRRQDSLSLTLEELEDTPTSLDVMWASSQTGCGPLKRLLMEVESIRQPAQTTSDLRQSFDLGRTKKATSAPASFIPSRPSTSTGHCSSNESQLRPMKRIRSGPHVFSKEPTTSGDDKSQQSQSFDLLGGGKFATEMLARVSRSLNQKAISEYSNSQKQPITGQQQSSNIISKRRTQPLQAQSNIIHNRDYDVPTKSAMIKQVTSNWDLNTTTSTTNGPLMKPITNLKNSPKKERLKALLKTIDDDGMSSRSGTDQKTVLPVRNIACSEGLSKGKWIGIGQTSRSINYNASEKEQTASSSLNPTSTTSRRTSREAGCDVQHTAAKSMTKPRKNTISSPSRLPSKRTYRVISQDAEVHSMSLCLSDDEEKIHPAFHESTVETTVDSVDSVGEGDDSFFNDANSSSSYGDIDIDLSLLENINLEVTIKTPRVAK
ncbi:hypothetical protein Clacol_007203 [Clathrus columnatus]|uniref:RING-type domain-containing protein n=1 Tax=Clathrus columnatus TaxID=1419009 RepID=A0AAV5AJ50_9AGAM|nr:hypothetical protein Clacol_007203 [Clathrus columnatus]